MKQHDRRTIHRNCLWGALNIDPPSRENVRKKGTRRHRKEQSREEDVSGDSEDEVRVVGVEIEPTPTVEA